MTVHAEFVDSFFNEMNKSNVEEVCKKYYHPEVQFYDPVGAVHGLGAMTRYYSHLYANITSIHFEVPSEVRSENEIFAAWRMTMSHPAIGAGREITLDGSSHIRLEEGKIVYHRDYFDLGVMVYEHIFLLGRIVKYVKGTLSDH